MLINSPSKGIFANSLANFSIEISEIWRTKDNNQFSTWRSRVLQAFAEFAPDRLFDVHSLLIDPGLDNSQPKSLLNTPISSFSQLMGTIASEIDLGAYDLALQKLDSGYENPTYNLTRPQKRVLRILVSLREETLLLEPIVAFPHITKLMLHTISGIPLYPKDWISEFKRFDLNTYVEENLLSLAGAPDGRQYFTLKQSAIIAVNNFFGKQDAEGWASTQAIGSPYGFTQADWVFVKDQRSKRNSVVVTLGHKFKTQTYVSLELIKKLQSKFQGAIERFNLENPEVPITLDFKVLGAGFGEHLFNNIARNIMSSDISIFETSDLNPNVMLEMGVALTWGVSVFPIKKKGKDEPPSDISGQTWADYEGNGDFVEKNFDDRLFELVKRVIAKKRGTV